MKVLALLQARMSSTRLPGKVLKPILGKPMILRMIERLQRARTLEKIVVATSVHPTDDPLVAVLEKHGIEYYRGPLNDIMQRACEAASAFGPAEALVRLTGDCPLIDWRVIDSLVELFLSGNYAYASNVLPPTWPDGLDVEVMTPEALFRSCREAKLPHERRSVTTYIISHPELFPRANLLCPLGDLSWHRLTVDEPVDYEKIRRIFEALYPQKPDFVLEDILAYLQQHPDVMYMNQHIGRNEGSRKDHQP